MKQKLQTNTVISATRNILVGFPCFGTEFHGKRGESVTTGFWSPLSRFGGGCGDRRGTDNDRTGRSRRHRPRRAAGDGAAWRRRHVRGKHRLTSPPHPFFIKLFRKHTIKEAVPLAKFIKVSIPEITWDLELLEHGKHREDQCCNRQRVDEMFSLWPALLLLAYQIRTA